MRLDALETKDMLTQRATSKKKKRGRRQRGIVVRAEEKAIFYFGSYTSQQSQINLQHCMAHKKHLSEVQTIISHYV